MVCHLIPRVWHDLPPHSIFILYGLLILKEQFIIGCSGLKPLLFVPFDPLGECGDTTNILHLSR